MVAMAAAAPRGMTVAEFLADDDGTDTRYELVGGEMVPRSPADEPHMWIMANVYGAVAKRLRPGLRALGTSMPCP